MTRTARRWRFDAGPLSPLLRRLWRIPRVFVHVARGLCTIWFVFPSLDVDARRARVRRWSRQLVHMMGVDIRMTGTLAHPNVLVVANHVSWLDIFALHAAGPVRFIAKAEIARWPILGRLVAGVGTLFIDRARRHDTHRINGEVTAAIRAGDIVAIFPEATTSDGTRVLPFKGSLLQPIVDADGAVQPVAIRYRTRAGERSTLPAYVDDDTFVDSFWRVSGAAELVVDIVAAAPLPARGTHRRALALQAEAIIRSALAAPWSDFRPDKRGDPASESP